MIKNILPIILIGISVTGFFMFISPMYGSLGDLGTQIASYNEALNNAKDIKNHIDDLTTRYSKMDSNNIDKLQKLLPDSVNNIRLILEIEGLARPYGMVLKDIKYATTPATSLTAPIQGGAPTAVVTKDYGDWDLEFSTQGTYSNFVSFLKDLENNLRIVDLVGVDFSSDAGVGANPKTVEAYKYDIKIKTYWLKP